MSKEKTPKVVYETIDGLEWGTYMSSIAREDDTDLPLTVRYPRIRFEDLPANIQAQLLVDVPKESQRQDGVERGLRYLYTGIYRARKVASIIAPTNSSKIIDAVEAMSLKAFMAGDGERGKMLGDAAKDAKGSREKTVVLWETYIKESE